MKDVKNVAKNAKNQEKKPDMGAIIPIMTSMMGVIPVIQGVMAVENDDFKHPLDPDAETLAYKMQAYLKTKKGDLLECVRLKGKSPRYYWSIMTKDFCLVHPHSEMYIMPWQKTEKGDVYVYSPHTFWQGQVFLVPESEIIKMEFN